ncbi:hypothetical protein OKW45_002699 [Paraburkholderia sp. WSM4175]
MKIRYSIVRCQFSMSGLYQGVTELTVETVEDAIAKARVFARLAREDGAHYENRVVGWDIQDEM